jgi:lipoprotein
MKTLFKILFVILSIISLQSCDWINKNYTTQPQDDRIILSELTVVKNNGVKLFYRNNTLFSGEAWSSDKKTFFIICENGRLMELHGKNSNNTDAVVVNMRPGQEFGNGGLLDTFNKVYYLNDGGGNLIMRLGRVSNGFRHECYGGTIETITNQNFIQDAYPSHAQLLQTYEAVLDNELNMKK